MALTFVPGLELARQFYAEVVRPLLEQGAPGLRYSAALLGPGSEVLGFDSARSTDHDWGPRLQASSATPAPTPARRPGSATCSAGGYRVCSAATPPGSR